MTEAQYNSAIAIYNPNGGHRAGKIYDIKNTNDLTVTGGGGTRINKNGVVERVLTKTNHVLNYQDTETSNYSKTNVVVTANSILAPDGINMADRITTSGTEAVLRPTHFNSLAGTYTVSFWVRTVSGSGVIGVYKEQWQAGGTTVKEIRNINETWQRVSLTTTTIAGEYYAGLYMNNGTLGTTQNLECYVWGFQIENGELGSLIPTSGSSVTRIGAKIDYSTGSPAFLIEPARTNNEPWSYNLTESGYMPDSGLVVALNEVGITGLPNTASTVTDNSTSAALELGHSYKTQSGIGKTSVWIKKDSNQSRFPEFHIQFSTISSGIKSTYIQLNTATGESVFRGTENVTKNVIDRGDWWELVALSLESVQYGKVIIRPAFATSLGSTSSSATGSVIIGHVGIYSSSIVNETPIITNGSVVTRTVNKYKTTSYTGLPYFSFLIDFNNPNVGIGKELIRVGKDGGDEGQYNFEIGISTTNKLTWLNRSNYNSAGLQTTTIDIPVGRNKLMITHATGEEVKFTLNGVLVLTTGFTHGIHKENYTGYSINGNILAYHDLRLLPAQSNADAVTLTTL